MAKKVQNNGGIGNPYHSEANGQFVSPGDGSSNVQSGETTAVSNGTKVNSNVIGKSLISSFIKKDSNETFDNSVFEKVRKNRWWKNKELYTPQEVMDNIENFFDDDVLSFLEKYNLKTTDSLGAGNTSHAIINTPLTNAIAQKLFHPLNIMDTNKFDSIVKRLSLNGASKGRGVPHAEYGFTQRGFHNKDIIENYLGNKKADCVLPNGVYGSCIYTAYDGHTADGYAYGRNGYVMSFLVDNTKGKTITSSNYWAKKNEMINNLPAMKQKIQESMKKKGKDDNYSQRVAQIFENTLTKDYTFAGLLMGYDIIYEEGAQYGLLLNFKNTYTKKDW